MEHIPLEAIGKILTEVMDQAVKNGADSRSMPDDYVAVAHFVAYPNEYGTAAEIAADVEQGIQQAEQMNDNMRKFGTIDRPQDCVQAHPFYTMDGQPCPPDIEDELGQLLLACDKAIEFLTVGPAIEVTEDVVKAMYESNVVKLIPKLKAVIESRVAVKWPFAAVVGIHAKRITGSGFKPIDHLLTASTSIEYSNDRLMQIFEKYAGGIDNLNVGPNTMPYLADIVIHMQRIMTTFGWTWDDVKLKARQQIAENE